MRGISKLIPVKKLAQRQSVEAEEIELALEVLFYLISHFAKTNAVTIENFSAIQEQTGLKQDLGVSLYSVIKSYVAELREILDKENKLRVLSLVEVDQRLSLKGQQL